MLPKYKKYTDKYKRIIATDGCKGCVFRYPSGNNANRCKLQDKFIPNGSYGPRQFEEMGCDSSHNQYIYVYSISKILKTL